MGVPGSDLATDQDMSALLSLALTLVSALGIWTAVSLVSAPVLVCCIRSQARVNDRLACAGRRSAWTIAASRR
jgi:hypothetical protein